MQDSIRHGGKESLEEGIFELSVFLLTAARGLVDERHMYGPLRLLDGISRLTNLYSRSDLKPDPFLLKVKKQIDEKKDLVMSSEDKFVEFMDQLILEFTEELKRRYPLEGTPSMKI
jgi:hypothetical protein